MRLYIEMSQAAYIPCMVVHVLHDGRRWSVMGIGEKEKWLRWIWDLLIMNDGRKWLVTL